MSLYLKLQQYPILRHEINERMRQVLFERGVITPERFEREVAERAIASQHIEGLDDPFGQEPPEQWAERLAYVRDQMTLFFFAYNVPAVVFDSIVSSILSERTGQQSTEIFTTFNPELAPLDVLFRQGERLLNAAPDMRERVAHHLEEIRVVIIKSIISDQLEYIGVAKKWFDLEDLRRIRAKRIGRGKIGGKAAGVELAQTILSSTPGVAEFLKLPTSYFIATDVFTDFKYINKLMYISNQKYKTPEEIKRDYPRIKAIFANGQLPDGVIERLRVVLAEIGQRPLVVRSSSLLEDSFGTSFAGKYQSFFLGNQGTPDENLEALMLAITQVYASVYNPDALQYRKEKGLLDYDERMAILLQVVEGETHGDYLFPTLAGVGFSRNPFKWTDRIDPTQGFVRLVWGLGTRAVDGGAEDYPRMIALSHPMLRPEVQPDEIRRYSQHKIDVINLRTNQFEIHSIEDIIPSDLPTMRWLASLDRGGYLQPPLLLNPDIDPTTLVLTFEPLLRQSNFAEVLRTALMTLEEEYQLPVDIEFAARLQLANGKPEIVLTLLQCRPQSYRTDGDIELPGDIPESDVILRAHHALIPAGIVSDIRYAVYVDPAAYTTAAPQTKLDVARAIGRINQMLENERFVLIGPNRWGSNNPDLGVKVTYADINHARMLIEVAHRIPGGGGTPQPSHGTHFYQDLVEANIYPLAVFPEDGRTTWRSGLFSETPNALLDLLPEDAEFQRIIRVIDIPAIASGRHFHVVMDGANAQALGYLK